MRESFHDMELLTRARWKKGVAKFFSPSGGNLPFLVPYPLEARKRVVDVHHHLTKV